MIIATPEHRAAIEAELATRLINVEAARESGNLIVADARETLNTFFADGTVDQGAFRQQVGAIIEKALGGRTNTIVRAYGEMVDVLWQEGRTDAAIRVELLWNLLATSVRFCAAVWLLDGQLLQADRTARRDLPAAQPRHPAGRNQPRGVHAPPQIRPLVPPHPAVASDSRFLP